MITEQHFSTLLQHNRKYMWRHALVGVGVAGLAVVVVIIPNAMETSGNAVDSWEPIIRFLTGGSVGGISLFPLKKFLFLNDRRSHISQTYELWQMELSQVDPSDKNINKLEDIYWDLCRSGSTSK